MQASIEDLCKAARGVAASFPASTGITFSRLPAWTYPQHKDFPVVAKMAERLSGAHLVLSTSASKLVVRFHATRDVDSVSGWQAGPSAISVTTEGFEATVSSLDGDQRVWKSLSEFDVVPGEECVAEFDLPAASAPRIVEIWLPQNNPIRLLEVSADAPLEPATTGKPVWLHYGSSISHCEDADGPLGVWPVAAARELGLDIYNLGLAGSANLEQFTARTIRDLSPNLISLKLGINIVNGAHMTSRTFVPAVHGFIDTIREALPETPILVISPVCCPAHEQNPGPSEEIDGKVHGQPFGRHEWIGELTLQGIRELLKDIVATRGSSDSKIFYLDGLALFGLEDGLTMPDGIHPDAEGYKRIAANFLASHPREWITALER